MPSRAQAVWRASPRLVETERAVVEVECAREDHPTMASQRGHEELEHVSFALGVVRQDATM